MQPSAFNIGLPGAQNIYRLSPLRHDFGHMEPDELESWLAGND
jgi:hypothetical protein